MHKMVKGSYLIIEELTFNNIYINSKDKKDKALLQKKNYFFPENKNFKKYLFICLFLLKHRNKYF